MDFLVNLFILLDSTIYNTTGLLFVVLGVFVLIRAAGFPDLTIDGSFTIGAAVFSICLFAGYGILPALTASTISGALGGAFTWSINSWLGVGKVVSGILSMIVLILSAPYISGGSTKSLLNVESIFSYLDTFDANLTVSLIGDKSYQLHLGFSAIVLALFCIIGTLIFLFLRSRLGLRLRYVGSAISPTLIAKTERKKILLIALMLGNALIAFGGSIEAQRRGGFTNNMGIGIVLVALAVLVLGEAILKTFLKREYLRLKEHAMAIVLGCFLYSAGIQILLTLELAFVDLRLLTAIFLLLLLGIAGRVHSSSTKLF